MESLPRDVEDKLLANDRALGLPQGFTKAQFSVESGLSADAVSRAGARGWAQIMPSTQAALEGRMGRKFDPANIDDALTMHQAVMRENLGKFGNLPDALRAYNGGWDRKKWSNRETEAYPYKVMAGLGGGARSDSQPQGMAALYRKGAAMPASFSGDDSDIFVDGPNARQAKAGRTPTGAGGADDDIFADLPKAVKTQAASEPKAEVNPDDFLPTDGAIGMLPNSVKAGIVSTGRELDKLWQGAKSGVYRMTGQDEALAQLMAEEASKDAVYRPLEQKHPIATTVGAVAPYMAVTPGAFASMPAAALRTIAPKAAAKIGQSMVVDGALQGAILGQLRQGDETDAVGGATGGAIGGGLGRLTQKVLSPNLGGNLSAQQRAAASAGRELGGQLTPGQALGSRTLQRIEAGLESNPLTSFAMQGVKDTNQKAMNRAAAKAIGEVGDVVDATTFANAERRIDGIYKMVKTKNKVGLDHLSQPVSDIMDEARTLTIRPGALDEDPLFSKAVDFITGGGATQEQLATLSSQLGKRAKTMMTSAQGDRELGKALFMTKDALDDALEGALNGQTKKAFADARSQYRALMQLYPSGVVNEQTGNVSGRMLANGLARGDRKGFRLGGNDSDMYTMARFARAFPAIVGDSGTATRLALPLAGAAAGGAYGAGTGDVGDAVKFGLFGAAAPMLAAKAYMSPAGTAYLGNGLISTGMPGNIVQRLANSSRMALPITYDSNSR